MTLRQLETGERLVLGDNPPRGRRREGLTVFLGLGAQKCWFLLILSSLHIPVSVKNKVLCRLFRATTRNGKICLIFLVRFCCFLFVLERRYVSTCVITSKSLN